MTKHTHLSFFWSRPSRSQADTNSPSVHDLEEPSLSVMIHRGSQNCALLSLRMNPILRLVITFRPKTQTPQHAEEVAVVCDSTLRFTTSFNRKYPDQSLRSEHQCPVTPLLFTGRDARREKVTLALPSKAPTRPIDQTLLQYTQLRLKSLLRVHLCYTQYCTESKNILDTVLHTVETVCGDIRRKYMRSLPIAKIIASNVEKD